MQIFLGWVATLIVAGVTAGLLTAVLVYSPSKLMSDDRVFANKALDRETLSIINQARAIGLTGAAETQFTVQLLCLMLYALALTSLPTMQAVI